VEQLRFEELTLEQQRLEQVVLELQNALEAVEAAIVVPIPIEDDNFLMNPPRNA
jgi:C4-dicarboxylate-specific signal transduction histidine kinase